MSIRRVVCVSVLCVLGVVGAVTAEEEWQTLTGADLSSWREPTADWKVVGAAVVSKENERLLVADPKVEVSAENAQMLNGPKGRTKNILTRHEHGDIEAHIEFMVPKGSNSGVYFQGRYEIQVLDSWGRTELKHGDCGGIYQRWHKGKGFEGHPPKVNASRAPGQWQSFDVVFRAPRFDDAGKKIENAKFVKVAHNGVVVHEDVELTGPTRAATYNDEKPVGPIMLQGDHGPVAYRNIRIRAIK